MTHGTWLAYCTGNRVIPLEALGNRLASDQELTVRYDRTGLLVVAVHDSLTGNDAEVTVSIDVSSHVPVEAKELAEALTAGRIQVDQGVPAPNAAALASADARYELTWELQFSDETYNPMMVIAGLLLHEAGAVIYDVTNRRFV